jgi:hypothetical protein
MLRRRPLGFLTYIKSGSEPDFASQSPGSLLDMFILVQPVVALLAGILILAMPRLLNYIVALYLIIIGILGLVT